MAELCPRPERWEQVECLFAAALAVAPAERPAWLAARAGGDSALAAEVESLLAADAASGAFLDGLGSEPAAEPQAGDRVGPYELIRELGRGGSGVVFLARRAEGGPGPEVALKMLRPGLWGRLLERRFRTEWKILASLEHPNIARLQNVGTHRDGTPYYVMEHVEGVPLDRHCDERRLGIEERLALFATVCDTVHFAHQHRIVHRDIKPANILVTSVGTPKLLDFGIAKLLDPQALAIGETTGTWMRVLTPQYASPEQVLGQPIAPASDVYSLGVVLYRLLTGRLPHSPPAASLDELSRRLRTRALRPSAAVLRPPAASDAEHGPPGDGIVALAALRGLSPAALSRRLSGGLDRIVARAMAREPGQRYPTAADLAAEVRKHLARGPARSWPAGLLDLAWRLSRRPQAAVAALLFVGLGLGAATSIGRGSTPWRRGQDAWATGTDAERRLCVPDGGADDTLLATDCCSGVSVRGSTVCAVATDFGTSWSSCKHVCGSLPVTCIPAGGVDDTLELTHCCSGTAVPGSTHCLDPADFGATWRTCVQTCA